MMLPVPARSDGSPSSLPHRNIQSRNLVTHASLRRQSMTACGRAFTKCRREIEMSPARKVEMTPHGVGGGRGALGVAQRDGRQADRAAAVLSCCGVRVRDRAASRGSSKSAEPFYEPTGLTPARSTDGRSGKLVGAALGRQARRAVLLGHAANATPDAAASRSVRTRLRHAVHRTEPATKPQAG
jgi:hypothetical protein